MDHLGLIGLIAGLALAVRAAGLYQRRRPLSEFWTRFFKYAPLGAITALVVPNLGLTRADGPARLAGALAAIVAVRWAGQMWPGIVAGMGVFWLARVFFN